MSHETPALLDRDGCAIAYRLIGAGADRVLFLQPFWSALADLGVSGDDLVSRLATGGAVLVHDRRGTGASERAPADVSLDAQVADLTALLAAVGWPVVAVVAVAEAAPLAVRLAARLPERVSRLVLVDPTLRPITGPGSTMLVHTLRKRPDVGLHAFARTIVSDDDAATALAARLAEYVAGPLAARLYTAFLDANASAVLGKVTAPALFISGVYDRLVSEDEAAMLTGLMPSASAYRVAAIAGSGVALAEAWQRIAAFLARSPTAALTPAPSTIASVAADGAVEPALVDAEPADDQPNPLQRLLRWPVGRQRSAPIDYVPAGGPPSRSVARSLVAAGAGGRSVAPAPLKSGRPSRPVLISWGPPEGVPEEAVALNRRGIDKLLLGEIDAALNCFQQAMDLAPHYQDAAINHRELLSRLVQRRVLEWQDRVSEEVLKDSEQRKRRRRAQTEESSRRPMLKLALPFGKSA